MKNGPLRIIQITDLHLFEDPEKELLGVKSEESFKAVVKKVQSEKKKIDFILLTGDLSQDCSEKAYKRIAKLLKVFKVPIYCVPGNHDDLQVMKKVYPCGLIKKDRQIVFNKWQIILLDSHIPNVVKGRLGKDQLKFLEKCLSSHPDKQAMVVFHHHPLSIDCKWLDKQKITNARAFWKVIAKYPQVNTILFGHIHQEFKKIVNSIKCFATPSTCFQFKRKQDNFAIENLPPGYRWLELYDDGRIKTGIVRVPEYIGFFDKEATGY